MATKRQAKYPKSNIGLDDLLQALDWLQEHVRDASYDVRRLEDKNGVARLRLELSGYRNQVAMGMSPRVVATAWLPSARAADVTTVLYNLVYTLAEQTSDVDEAPGRFTELFPGWKPT